MTCFELITQMTDSYGTLSEPILRHQTVTRTGDPKSQKRLQHRIN